MSMSAWYYRQLVAGLHAAETGGDQAARLPHWIEQHHYVFLVCTATKYSTQGTPCTKKAQHIEVQVKRLLSAATGDDLQFNKRTRHILVFESAYLPRYASLPHFSPLFTSVLLVKKLHEPAPPVACKTDLSGKECWCNLSDVERHKVVCCVDVERTHGLTCGASLDLLFASDLMPSFQRNAIYSALRSKSFGMNPSVTSWNMTLLRRVVMELRKTRPRWRTASELAGALLPWIVDGSSSSTFGYYLGLFGQRGLTSVTDQDSSATLEDAIASLCPGTTSLSRQADQDVTLYANLTVGQRVLLYPLMYHHESEQLRDSTTFEAYVVLCERLYACWRGMVYCDSPVWMLSELDKNPGHPMHLATYNHRERTCVMMKSVGRDLDKLASLILSARVSVTALIHISSQIRSVVSSYFPRHVLVCPNDGLRDWLCDILYPAQVITLRQLFDTYSSASDLPTLDGEPCIAVLYAHLLGYQQWLELIEAYDRANLTFVVSYFGSHGRLTTPRGLGLYQKESINGFGNVYHELRRFHPEKVNTVVGDGRACTTDAYRISHLVYQAVEGHCDAMAAIETVRTLIMQQHEPELVFDVFGVPGNHATVVSGFLCVNTGRVFVPDRDAINDRNVHLCECYVNHPATCSVDTRYVCYHAQDHRQWMTDIQAREKHFAKCMLTDRPSINCAINAIRPFVGPSGWEPIIGVSEYNAPPLQSVAVSLRLKKLSLVDVARAAVHSLDRVSIDTRNTPCGSDDPLRYCGLWPPREPPYLFDRMEDA